MLVFLCISYSYQTVSHALLDLSMGIFEEIEAAMFEDEMSDVKAAILKTAILKVYFKSIMRMKCLFDIYLTYMISLDNFSRTRSHFIILHFVATIQQLSCYIARNRRRCRFPHSHKPRKNTSVLVGTVLICHDLF